METDPAQHFCRDPMSFAIAHGTATALCSSTCDWCTPAIATLCAIPSCLVAASRGIVPWGALVFVVAPGFSNIRSHSSQTVAFAHFDSGTVRTACPGGSSCYLCMPAMRVISCPLRTYPCTQFVAKWPNLDISKMLILLIVSLLPQPW